jgi:hypothetical protein
MCRDALDAPRHLGRGAARKGQQHDPSGIDAVDDEMRNAVRQRIGLARSGTGYDQEGRWAGEVRATELNGAALFRVEMGKMRRGHRDGRAGRGVLPRARTRCHARTSARPDVRIIEYMPATPRLNHQREQITNEKTSSRGLPRSPISLAGHPGYSGCRNSTVSRA